MEGGVAMALVSTALAKHQQKPLLCDHLAHIVHRLHQSTGSRRAGCRHAPRRLVPLRVTGRAGSGRHCLNVLVPAAHKSPNDMRVIDKHKKVSWGAAASETQLGLGSHTYELPNSCVRFMLPTLPLWFSRVRGPVADSGDWAAAPPPPLSAAPVAPPPAPPPPAPAAPSPPSVMGGGTPPEAASASACSSSARFTL